DRGADALAAAGAGIVEGAGVAVVARGTGIRRHGAARRPVAGPRVALVGGAGDRRPGALAAAGAGIAVGAGVAVVARRVRERRHRAARRPVAGPRVALVGGAGDRRADALAAAGAGIAEGAGVAVVARRIRERRHGAARRPVAGPRVALVGGAGDRGAGALAAAGAGIAEGAGVAVVARRVRVRRHRAARRPGAARRVALVGGAGDRGAGALAAAGAGIAVGAGVAVVARRVRERCHRAARRPVAGPRVALVGGAGDRRPGALAAAGAGIAERAGVAVVARGTGIRRHRAARRPVAGPRVALVGGAGDRRPGALAAAGAGIAERARVAVVARRIRERRHGAARRPVAGPRVALVGGAGDRGADALAAA